MKRCALAFIAALSCAGLIFAESVEGTQLTAHKLQSVLSGGTSFYIKVTTITFRDGTTQITAGGGGGGGSSSLKVSLNGVQVSSPTGTINLSSGFTATESPTGTANVGVNFSSVASQSNLSSYLTTSSASTTYFPLVSSTTLLTTSSATATYLNSNTASSTYLTQSSASATYFQSASSGTLLTTSSATANYLNLSSASATYFQPKNPTTSNITEGTNQYFTTARATSAVSGSAPLTYSNGVFGVDSSSVTLLGQSIPANKIASGSLGSAVIASSVAASGVVAGTYGSGTQVAVITVGGDGRVTSASNTTITSSGGGGSSTLAISSNNVVVSSPTSNVNFMPPFIVALQGSTSAQVTLNASSVTLQGTLSASTPLTLTSGAFGVSASSVTLQANTFNGNSQLVQTSASGLIPNSVIDSSSVTKFGSSIPASSVASGSLGSSVIASSISASGVVGASYGTPTQVSSFTVNGDGRITNAASMTISLTNSNLQSGTYSNVTVPAANVASGSLGSSVIASSCTNTMLVSSFPVSGVTAASYTNTNLTVNAQGIITSASNGTGGSGGGGGYNVEPASVTFQLNKGLSVSTISFQAPYAVKSLFLNAGSGLCQTNNGCISAAQFQTTTSSVNYIASTFQAGTTQYWQTNFTLPRNYVAASTFTVNFVWTSTMAVTANWKVDMMSVANVASIDTAWGSSVSVSTSSSATNLLNISQDSGAVTPAGSPDVNKELYVRVYRNGDVTGDVRFLGLRLYYLYNKLSEN